MKRRDRAASLDPVRKVFEEFGRDDPLYAALSESRYRHNRWEPAAFFQTGVEEIAAVMAHVAELGLDVQRRRALDFGSAVGRLTQALADHFDEVVGVDIAASMVERARSFNRHGERVSYVVNTAPDLSIFEGGSFDFIYTNKVLQHIPPAVQTRYIAEFMRVLRPHGVAVFQTRNGPRIRPGTLRALLYTLNRQHFRRLVQRVRGRQQYEMHFVARSLVQEIIEQGGGRIVDVVDLGRSRPGKSLLYYVRRQD